MYRRGGVLFGLMLVCLGCSSKEPEDRGRPSTTPAVAENAVVSDALSAQLEALGCVRKDAKPSVAPEINPYENADLSPFLEGVDAAFVFHDLRCRVDIVENPERSKRRFSPCSTFKIPNTLIALETGVATGPSMEMKWDREKYPKEPWWDEVLKPMGIRWDRDHTLKSAFRNSCVWSYRELAKRVGQEKMQAFLNDFDYGNKDISGGIDHFWLDSTLEISAVEQVAFLKKLVQNDLPIREKTRSDALQVFERERRKEAVLYAKTGGGERIGWFVGFIESGRDRYIFAFNMAGTYDEVKNKRVELSINMLKELGVWL